MGRILFDCEDVTKKKIKALAKKQKITIKKLCLTALGVTDND